MAISPVDGKTAYVVNSGSGTVSVLTASNGTYQVTRTITVGSSPTGVAVGTDGRVYVARSASTVTVITNPTSSTFSVSTIQLGTGTSPTALAVTPDGKQVYVANSGTKTLSVIETSSQTVIYAIPLGGATPTSIAISSDGSIAYVATTNDTVMVIDTQKKTIINTVAIDPLAPETGGHVIAFGPGGTRIYISDAVDNKLRVVAIYHANTPPQTTGEPTGDVTDPFPGDGDRFAQRDRRRW